jgi:hypothetical protein
MSPTALFDAGPHLGGTWLNDFQPSSLWLTLLPVVLSPPPSVGCRLAGGKSRVPEATSNVEFAHKIHEHGHHRQTSTDRRTQWVEIIEAVLLAIVAVATAWSGYQAAKWDALSAEQYNLALRSTVISQEETTLAGQDHLYDVITFDAWLTAKLTGEHKLAELQQRRFRPEFAKAFAAWQKLDPLNNPAAPVGPSFMKEYRDANNERSASLAADAKRYFEKAVSARTTGDDYVKITVLLATVLLLTALSQRFSSSGPRMVVVGVALALLLNSTYLILTFPKA